MWELRKTDHGIDGWDARTWVVGHFTTHAKAMAYLRKRSFTWEEYGSYYHDDVAKRNTMGAISYKIDKAPHGPDIDPE